MRLGCHAAPACRLPSAERTAEIERLSGNNGGLSSAHVHAVGIHDPRHDLLVRVHVRRRDVPVRAERVEQIRSVTPRNFFQFDAGQLCHVAPDRALGSPERNIHDRTLPRHPGSEGLDLVQRDVGSIPDSPLRGAQDVVVNHPIALKNFDTSIVHLDGN